MVYIKIEIILFLMIDVVSLVIECPEVDGLSWMRALNDRYVCCCCFARVPPNKNNLTKNKMDPSK